MPANNDPDNSEWVQIFASAFGSGIDFFLPFHLSRNRAKLLKHQGKQLVRDLGPNSFALRDRDAWHLILVYSPIESIQNQASPGPVHWGRQREREHNLLSPLEPQSKWAE